MNNPALQITAFGDLLARYARVFSAAWGQRDQLTPKARTPLERQFLPAALEIIETPAPALPRAIIATIVTAFLLAIAWASIGMIDMVAIAPGKIISADRAKVIQPAETAVVKRLLVRDGQQAKAGEPLMELEAAATAAETERLRDAISAARLESAATRPWLSPTGAWHGGDLGGKNSRNWLVVTTRRHAEARRLVQTDHANAGDLHDLIKSDH